MVHYFLRSGGMHYGAIAPTRISRHAPEFGEHTEEVLMERLGFDWDRLGDLKTRGMI